MIDLPTKTAPMREAILLALAKLHAVCPEDRGHMKGDVQWHIAELAGREEMPDWLFDERGATGKAFERAFEQLRAEGIVIVNPDDPNEIEYTLAIYEEVDEDG